MPEMKTPGVYIVEKNAFPNSVVEVATGIPAFIGYTSKAEYIGKSLLNTPQRIGSQAEFIQYFGGAPQPEFNIDEAVSLDSADIQLQPGQGSLGKKGFVLRQNNQRFILFHSIEMFFQNGGGPCYIVSVGNYDGALQGDGKGEIKAAELISGLETLENEEEPTIVVIPDAVSLTSPGDCQSVQQAALVHCGARMKNRMAILDVYNGYRDRQHPDGDCIADFRNSLGNSYRGFAAAYYPWLNSTVVRKGEISFDSLSSRARTALQKIIKSELKVEVTDDIPLKSDGKTPTSKGQRTLDNRKELKAKIEGIIDFDSDFKAAKAGDKYPDKTDEEILAIVRSKRETLHKALLVLSPFYSSLLDSIEQKVNLLPPSAAMAGLYAYTDSSRGVWKAPANLLVQSVSAPAVNITHDEQEDLNVSTDGKSVNAIRSFPGSGTLVWGARTLDGNSTEWRYINVRRTMIMLEESMRLAVKAYVFEANNDQTWIAVKGVLNNFLTGIWKRGALAGSSPAQAFSIRVGLGETMTQNDIIEGKMRVYAQVAVNRPAEFMVITIEQDMHKA